MFIENPSLEDLKIKFSCTYYQYLEENTVYARSISEIKGIEQSFSELYHYILVLTAYYAVCPPPVILSAN